VLLMVNLGVSSTAFAKAGITKNKPVVLAPPEEKMPVETVEKKGGKTWLWALLGIVVVGGAVAALAGGSEDSNDDDPTPSPPPDTGEGDVTVTW